MGDLATPPGVGLWAGRAAAAEQAVVARHLRRLWGMPGAVLGVARWPASAEARCHGRWNYWWQAHVLDCLVDAHQRSPTSARTTTIERLLRGIHRRNAGRWTNAYYDDIAWLGLALWRADQYAGLRRPDALAQIAARLRSGWTDHAGGGIWWRRDDDFKNVPANGPAAILFARLSRLAYQQGADRADRQRARSIVEWMDHTLLDPDTGLVWDGLHVAADGSVRMVEKVFYTYCQGVYLGACVELAGLDRSVVDEQWRNRAVRTIAAVDAHLTARIGQCAVLCGQGGGDGGLFAGILARYLALAATALPVTMPAEVAATRQAADLVYASAQQAWRNRTAASGGPVFGPEWSMPAVSPARRHGAEGDLSVQTGAWMVLEAAALLERLGVTPSRTVSSHAQPTA